LLTFVLLEGAVIGLSYQTDEDIANDGRDALTANAGYKLALVNMLIEEKFQHVEELLELLTEQGPLRDYLIKPSAERRSQVQQQWQELLNEERAFERISFTELNGNERFGSHRQRSEPDQITPIAKADLRSFNDSWDLQSLEALNPKTLYIPPGEYRLDQDGKPTLPLELIFTAIIPVEFAKRRVGYLQLELSSVQLAESLKKLPKMEVGEPMIVSHTGYYRLHPDPSRVAGDVYPERRHFNLSSDYPTLWQHLQADHDKGVVGVFQDLDEIFVYSRMQLNLIKREPSFSVFRITDALVQSYVQRTIDHRHKVMVMGFVLAMFIALLVGLISGNRGKRLHQQRLAEAMVESMSAVVVTDSRGVVQDVNPSFERITGFMAEDIVGQMPDMLKSAEHPPHFYGRLLKTLQDTGFWRGEVWCRSANDLSHPVLVEIHAIKDKRGRVTNYVGSCLDLAEQKRLEIELRERSLRDPLTGCWNRRFLTELLKNEFARQRRFGQPLALASFDIDNFKLINDTYGHGVGDQVLQRCCDIVSRHLRSSDSLCRVGGEEFVLVLPMSNRQGAEILIERIRTLLAADKSEPHFTASFGLTVVLPNDNAEELLKRADTALYAAKAEGRNCSMFATVNRVQKILVDEKRLYSDN
jgi:diguanylate cyclase (GGDEF)-like protein/PAS domain S-box-containing protein